jgi:esterase/lipase
MGHVRETTEEISTPTLVLQALDDRTLSTKGPKLLRKWVTHAESEVVLMPFGTHALTRGKAKEEVFERTFTFAENLGIITPSG